MRVNLTERFAKTARADGRKSPIFYEDEVIGFGLQVRDNGRKTFTLDYTFEGVPVGHLSVAHKLTRTVPPSAGTSAVASTVRAAAGATSSAIIRPGRSRPRGTRRVGSSAR